MNASEATSFIVANQKRLFKTCRYLTRTNMEAQDLLQDCNEKILRLISEGKISDKMNITFFQKVIKNHCYDLYRGKQAIKRVCLRTSELSYRHSVIPQPEPEDMRDMHSVEDVIHSVWNLAPIERLIVTARMNSVKFNDIAKDIGWNCNTIRPVYRRILAKMKPHLKYEDFFKSAAVVLCFASIITSLNGCNFTLSISGNKQSAPVAAPSVEVKQVAKPKTRYQQLKDAHNQEWLNLPHHEEHNDFFNPK